MRGQVRAPDHSTGGAGDALIRVEGVQKLFPVRAGLFTRARLNVHAVDGVSFTVRRGEIFGLVGESGCGKTTTGRLLVGLLPPTRGRIHVDGEDIATLSGKRLAQFRRKVQMIFQDPYESLNPRLSALEIVGEPLVIHRESGVEEQVAFALETVGLSPAADFMLRYPHELSGGQRQRVAIARALVINPEFVVADEPVSMLDASLRAGVMNLLLNLRDEFALTYVLVTHDLAVARYMCDRLAVMYLGKIVEIGLAEEVIRSPKHPYTQALIAAVPAGNPFVRRERVEIRGAVPTPVNPKPGCRFADRCPAVMEVYRQEHPGYSSVGHGHQAACYLYSDAREGEVKQAR